MAALVAAASLAVTAWGTWKAAQVADDQLAQSREADETRQRQQVSQVTFWEEDKTVVVVNRSMDPVYGFLAVTPPDGDFYSLNDSILMQLGTVPPCRRVTVPDSIINEYMEKIYDGRGAQFIQALWVRDANGRFWQRNWVGKVQAHPMSTAPGQAYGHFQLMDNKKVRRQSAECADDE